MVNRCGEFGVLAKYEINCDCFDCKMILSCLVFADDLLKFVLSERGIISWCLILYFESIPFYS